MIRKIILLASITLVVIAVAAPAAARAVVVLTEEEGQSIAVGAKVTATTPFLHISTGLGSSSLSCDFFTLHLEVDANGPNHVVLDQIGPATTQNCQVNESDLPATILDGTLLENLTINTWGTGQATTTLITKVFSPLDPGHIGSPLQTCDYEGGLHFRGQEWGSDVLFVTPSPLTAVGCSSAMMSASFTLETSDESPVELDFIETD